MTALAVLARCAVHTISELDTDRLFAQIRVAFVREGTGITGWAPKAGHVLTHTAPALDIIDTPCVIAESGAFPRDAMVARALVVQNTGLFDIESDTHVLNAVLCGARDVPVAFVATVTAGCTDVHLTVPAEAFLVRTACLHVL